MTSEKKYNHRRKTDSKYKHSRYNANDHIEVTIPLIEGLRCQSSHCLEGLVAGKGALVIRDGKPSVYHDGCRPVFGRNASIVYLPVKFYYSRRETDKNLLKKYHSK